MDPINLIDKYKDSDVRKSFEAFKLKLKFFANENYKFDLKTGDQILFLNGYDVPMISEILGFDENGDAYMLWDCYWASIDLKTRLIKKL